LIILLLLYLNIINIMESMKKFCEKCNEEKEISSMVRKTSKVSVTRQYSSGCSIRTYYYCPSCAPDEAPTHTPTIIVGSVISI